MKQQGTVLEKVGGDLLNDQFPFNKYIPSDNEFPWNNIKVASTSISPSATITTTSTPPASISTTSTTPSLMNNSLKNSTLPISTTATPPTTSFGNNLATSTSPNIVFTKPAPIITLPVITTSNATFLSTLVTSSTSTISSSTLTYPTLPETISLPKSKIDFSSSNNICSFSDDDDYSLSPVKKSFIIPNILSSSSFGCKCEDRLAKCEERLTFSFQVISELQRQNAETTIQKLELLQRIQQLEFQMPEFYDNEPLEQTPLPLVSTLSPSKYHSDSSAKNLHSFHSAQNTANSHDSFSSTILHTSTTTNSTLTSPTSQLPILNNNLTSTPSIYNSFQQRLSMDRRYILLNY